MNREGSCCSLYMSRTADPLADIGETLEKLAVSQPDAPAIHVPGRTSLRYRNLGEQIRYVRALLANWDISRGDIVAGVIPLRPEMALACATIPAAATFAPLSPAFTADGYSELLARLRPKALVVPKDFDHPARLAARRFGVAEIELVPGSSAPAGMFTLELARQQDSLVRTRSAQRDWAYVMATSGTTGRPKLVPRSHHLLSLHARTLSECWRLTPDDVGCHLLPMHHGHGLSAALIVPLLRGASVVCLAESDIDGYFSALDEYGLTWLTAGFTLHREILRRAPEFPEAVARNKLRFVRAGSGRLDPDEIDRIERTFGVPLLVALSGREVLVMTHDPLPPRVRKRGSVGLPLCNEVAIMNEAGALCATGDVGEIVVRGPLVFDGYFDDAQATAAAFVDGWFRTGDLGRFDEDGYLYLTGRIKELINRGGEKISPVEVDAAIEAMPGVREAATFAVPHQSLGEEVVAAVVRENDAVEASDIIEQVRRRMGPKQVPRKIFFVDQLPRTDAGKLRRSELPRLLGIDQSSISSPSELPVEAPAPTLSPLEAALMGLWSSVLQVRNVGVDDDFFLLGGDSLRAVELLVSIERVFGIELPVDAMYGAAATVSKMAQEIKRLRAGAGRAQEDAQKPAQAVAAARSHRAIRAVLCVDDIVTTLTFLGLVPVAWLLPHKWWPTLCDTLARVHVALRGLAAEELDESLAKLDVHLTSVQLQRRLLSSVYQDVVMTLREQLPGAWRPTIRLLGVEHISAARAAGRGAVLWSCPSPFGGLISNKALKAAGIDLVNLRSAIHPYSGTRFGVKLLNPVRTRVENRYLASTVTLEDAEGLSALQELRRHLEANTVITIAANGAEGTPFEMPFLAGTLKLSLGAPTLAALHDAPLLPVFTAANGAGGFEVVIGPPVEAKSQGHASETARELARGYAGMLEAHLRRHPAEWRGWFMRNTWSPGPSTYKP